MPEPPARIAKLAIVKDKRALRAHLERLAAPEGLRWVIPGHGELNSERVSAVLRSIAATLG